jgi:lipoyl(octanoyl) transferase
MIPPRVGTQEPKESPSRLFSRSTGATPLNRDLCQVCWLGRIDYLHARTLQELLARARAEDCVTDTLLLLEHPPIYTLGRRGSEEHVLVSQQVLEKQGVAIYRTDRGGGVTFHGPGQLVGYPVVSLKDRQGGLGRYLRDLEEILIQVLSQFSISAGRLQGFTGVWVVDRKIAAIGVKLNAGRITGHGFALNVTTDLSYFSQIVPCGIRHKGVTSIARVLGHEVPLVPVRKAVAKTFSKAFKKHAEEVVPEKLFAFAKGTWGTADVTRACGVTS